MMTRSDAWKLGWEMHRRHWRGAMRWALCLLALPGCELATDMPGAPPPATDSEAQAPPADTQQPPGVQRGAEIAQHALLEASNPETQDRFGWSVALSGDTLVVGASWEGSGATGVDGDQEDERAPGSGAVYVFRRRGTAWVQEAYLKDISFPRV